jgi:hypothetical protein
LRMNVGGNAVAHLLQPRVDQLRQNNAQHAADQQRPFNPALAKP